MQPAVTNTQVSYNVPNGVTVTTIPNASLPVIFIGERLLVYAMIHQSSSPSEVQEGSVRLTGDLLGAKVEHNMKFRIPLAVTKENMLQVLTIHHLASKKLIKEMELDLDSSCGERRAEIIQLSCDSNVISSLTAFIAIDEERKEAVKGRLEIWDILPEYEQDSASYTRPKFRLKRTKAALEACSPPEAFFRAAMCTQRASSSAPEPKKRADKSITKNPMTRIISLQLASGAWKMSTEVADVIAKTRAELKDACPVSCKGDMETIWATIIVLVYLQLRQSNFKDEWELVAAKAEAWLIKQNLPQEYSIQVLREKGTAFLS